MRNGKTEILLFAILGGFAGLFLLLSRDYNPTAALFPRVIAIASLVFLSILIVQFGVSRPQQEASENNGTSRAAIFGLQGAYLVLIYCFGFFTATLLFLLVAPVQLRYKRWSVVFAHAVVVTLVLAGSFLWLFNIQLPSGALWDLW